MLHQLSLNPPSQATPCPICGSAGGRYGRRGYYLKCPDCKVSFRPEQRSSGDLDKYWHEDFWTEDEIEKRREREPVFRHALKILRDYKPDAGSVLDIGCGIGTFLAVARDVGWNVVGVEPSSTACEIAKREYGLELINEPFSSRLFLGRKFDAVFAAQVLHHLKDPAAFVADVDRVLADDGILILRTPNLVAERPILFLQRLLGKEQGFFCGPALYVFNPTTLTLLLQRLGYHDISFINSRPYLEAPTKAWRSPQGAATNLKLLSLATIKVATYGFASAVYALSSRRAVIGPSIFMIARKGVGSETVQAMPRASTS
jgi:SAM-dependent methyltransferase